MKSPVQLAYRWAGLSAGPVLVLSHSLGASSDMWQRQVDAFGGHFRLLIPDHRGHGRSPVPDGGYSIEQFGFDLVSLLDTLQIDRVCFCGLSLGGMVGMWLGRYAPNRVEKLVLCNTSARIEDVQLLKKRIDLVCREGVSAIADNVLARWFTDDFRNAKPEVVKTTREMLLSTSATGYANTSEAVCRLDLVDDLAQVRCPTLVIAGEHDRATPVAWNQAVAEGIARAKFVTLDAAHMSNIEASDEFNRVVLEFLLAS